MCTSKCHVIIGIQSKDFLIHKPAVIVQERKTVLVAAKIIAPPCKNEPQVVTSLLNNHASKHLLYYSMNFAEAVVTTEVELNVLVQSVYYIKDMMRNLFQESRF